MKEPKSADLYVEDSRGRVWCKKHNERMWTWEDATKKITISVDWEALDSMVGPMKEVGK